jgi:multidrug efflux pump subunit AcrA (membrane-fusion protein)
MGSATETSAQPRAMPRAIRDVESSSTASTRHGRRLRGVIIPVLLVVAVIAIARAWPIVFVPPPRHVITASGRIEGREVTLAARTIQGRVKRLLADEGETATVGQPLAELDVPQQPAQVAATSANVLSLDAQVTQAMLDVAFTAKNRVPEIDGASIATGLALLAGGILMIRARLRRR